VNKDLYMILREVRQGGCHLILFFTVSAVPDREYQTYELQVASQHLLNFTSPISYLLGKCLPVAVRY